MQYKAPSCGHVPSIVVISDFRLHGVYSLFSMNSSNPAPYRIKWTEQDKLDLINRIYLAMYNGVGMELAPNELRNYNFHSTFTMIDIEQNLVTLNGQPTSRSRISSYYNTMETHMELSIKADIIFHGVCLIPSLDKEYESTIIWQSIEIDPKENMGACGVSRSKF